MTITVTISTGQRKILERFKPGVRLELDPATGRYSFFCGDAITTVDQRPVEAMLRSGALEKDAMGRCYIAPGLVIASNLATRKTHLADANGKPTVCRYTKHPRAHATWLVAAEFAHLPPGEECPDCLGKSTMLG